MRKINSIVIHHSASPEDTVPEEIKSWHLNRGFTDIGYHCIIYKSDSGWLAVDGRPDGTIGAHCKGFNAHSLGVCVCGNYEEKHIDLNGMDVLLDILCKWCKRYGISPDNIYGHRDKGNTPTLCPGKNLYLLLPQIRKEVQNHLEMPGF